MTRNEMRDWIGGCMKAKGFHDDGSGFADGGMVRVSLVFTEIVEAMQEVKRHWKEPVPDAIKDRMSEEMADTAIRLYDLAFKHQLQLDHHVGATEKPRDLGCNERHSLIIRCGRLVSIVARAFDCFEDCLDFSANTISQESYFFTGNDGLDEEANDAVSNALYHCESQCEKIGRNLNEAIRKKMAENMARPHKYGTPDASVAKADEKTFATVTDGFPDHPNAVTVDLSADDAAKKLKDAKAEIVAKIQKQLLETGSVKFVVDTKLVRLPTGEVHPCGVPDMVKE